MTVHLRPRRRCRGLESPASRKSSCRVASCQEKDKSSLKSYFQLTDVKIRWHLWGSSSIDKLLIFFVCRLGCSSIPYAARRCIGLSTTWKHSQVLSHMIVVLPMPNVPLQCRHCLPPQRVSHIHQHSPLRDKAMLQGPNICRHNWLPVHSLPAPLCCWCDNNWQSRIRWRRWRRCQRNPLRRPRYAELCLLLMLLML